MNRSWLVSAVIVGLAIIGGIIFWLTSFRLTAVTPKNNATNIAIKADISLTFSQPLGSPKPSFISQPPFDGSLKISGKVLAITPSRPLQLGTKYTVKVINIRSVSGKTIATTTLTFTTVPLSSSEATLRQQLPYTTDQFSIDYIATDQTYSVTLLSEPLATANAAALNYLAGFGVTPTNSKISFTEAAGLGNSVGP